MESPGEPLKTPSPRRWPRRVLIGVNILLTVVLLGGLGTYGYAKWRFDQVDKLDLGGVLRGDGGSAEPMNVLLVGSDDRTNVADESKSFGTPEEVGPAHSDTIMVMHVDPGEERAAILSLPRDLWVTIYDASGAPSGKQKINAAIQGGPEQLIKTIDGNFGIAIDHYIQVDFAGFRDIVSSIGGVPVRFDAPARDKMSGLNVPEAGCRVLGGDEALSFVRSRNYETYESGRWRQDPRADLSRIDRQQDFIRRVLRQAINKGARNPVTLNNLIGAGVDNVQLDSGFELEDIARLGKRFQSLDPNEVEMMTLPNTIDSVYSGGQMISILEVNEEEADVTIQRFLEGPPDNEGETVPPNTVSVRVLNGSGISGQANDTAVMLQDFDFVVSGKGDAGSFASATTKISYAPGQLAKANTLAQYVQGAKNVVEDKTLRGVDVVIVTGSSFGGIAAPGSPEQSTTSTDAPSNAEPSAAPDQDAC